MLWMCTGGSSDTFTCVVAEEGGEEGMFHMDSIWVDSDLSFPMYGSLMREALLSRCGCARANTDSVFVAAIARDWSLDQS